MASRINNIFISDNFGQYFIIWSSNGLIFKDKALYNEPSQIEFEYHRNQS